MPWPVPVLRLWQLRDPAPPCPLTGIHLILPLSEPGRSPSPARLQCLAAHLPALLLLLLPCQPQGGFLEPLGVPGEPRVVFGSREFTPCSGSSRWRCCLSPQERHPSGCCCPRPVWGPCWGGGDAQPPHQLRSGVNTEGFLQPRARRCCGFPGTVLPRRGAELPSLLRGLFPPLPVSCIFNPGLLEPCARCRRRGPGARHDTFTAN